MFIGRKEELEQLRSAVLSDEAQFIAVYGRRRIGKTFLVREAFGGKFEFQHAGLAKGGQAEQLAAFAESMKKQGGKAPSRPLKSWMEAFSLLRDKIQSSRAKKKVVFLDELSWMAASKNALLTALEYFWNSWASGRKDVVLVVSASSTSWMLNKVVHDKGGLYNRLTRRIWLRPFSLRECMEMTAKRKLAMTKIDVLKVYMAFGGVPYYWTLLEPGRSVAQNIDRLCFSESGQLRSEYDYLFSSLFTRPEPYVAIVSVLAKRKQGLTLGEIAEMGSIGVGGTLSRRLKELSACGFIREYRPYGKKKKDSLFQLIDPFTLFYFRFMENPPTDEHFIEHNLMGSKLKTWLGLSFELVCLLHVPQLKAGLGVSGVATNACCWRCEEDDDLGVSGHQIDLLIDRADGVINLCEMRYATLPYAISKDDEEDWAARVDDFLKVTKTKSSIQVTLVTPCGAKENTHRWAATNVLELDVLFIDS